MPLAQSSSTITTVSSKEIPEVMEYVQSITPKTGTFAVQSENNGIRSSEPDLVLGDLQTSEILEITDENSKSNYTFNLYTIESNNSENDSFFNLVVKESTKFGFISYITEYRPTSVWLENNRRNKQLSTYSGEILYFNIGGQFKVKATLTNGQFNTSDFKNPCPDTDGNNSNTGGGENSSGDGNSSNGGNTSGDSGNSSGNDDGSTQTSDCIWFVIASECDDGECDAILYIDCSDQKASETFDDFIRNPNPCLEEPCFRPNGDPCPCAQDGISCEEENEEESDYEDSNPDVGIIIELDVTCIKLKQLVQDPQVAAAISDLEGATDESSERGYSLEKDAESNFYTATPVSGDTTNTIFPNGGDVVGTMHIHTNIGQQMFSGEDVVALITTYITNGDRNNPVNPTRPEDIVMFVETTVGSFF